MAILLFTFMSAIIKAIADDVPSGQAVFFRSFFAIPVILIWLAQRGKLSVGLKTRNPMGHVWRGLFGTTAMGLTFTGLGLLPLPEVTAIGFATPIFTVILAAVLLGEKIRFYRVIAVAVGLLGVMVILWPRFSNIGTMEQTATIGALLILIATMLRSLVQIHIRQLVQHEDTAAIVFYFSVTASLLALLTLPFGWVVPDARTLSLLILAGFIGGVAQIFITSAYRFGSASMLAPYDYTSMIFAIVIGYIFFAELPTFVMLSGALLVIAAGVLVIWRERQLGVERGKARSVTDPKA
jgi:drug/metabolite transporter (DMT)-like permease